MINHFILLEKINKTSKKFFKKGALKHSHGKEAPSNITPALAKSMNINIWVVGTSNQLFIRGSSP